MSGADGYDDGAVLEVRAVRAHRHRTPLRRPFVTAARRTESVDSVVAELELEDGTLGQGSAAETVAVTGESAQSILDAVRGPLARAMVGASGSILELGGLIASVLPGATSARAAVDVALHDAWSRRAGRPLVEMLGGDLGRRFTNDMTVSLEDPETMARRASEAVRDGSRILKIKLGRDAAEDRRRLAAVVAAVPQVRLRLDANQGWDAASAIRTIGAFEADGLPVDLVEQPVPAADLEGMAAVRAAVRTPVMADESVWSAADARRIVATGAADLLNIKLAKTGGIREALAIADVAAEAGISCMLGAMMEPRISITAAAHVAAAHPAITLIDLDSPAWFSIDEPAGGYVEEDGQLSLVGGPGLGLARLPESPEAALSTDGPTSGTVGPGGTLDPGSTVRTS